MCSLFTGIGGLLRADDFHPICSRVIEKFREDTTDLLHVSASVSTIDHRCKKEEEEEKKNENFRVGFDGD